MLDIADVAPYLLERELISAKAVVDGRLKIVDRSRRNRVYIVTSDDEPGYVVKQAGYDGQQGVRHEAAVLAALRVANTRLAARLPEPALWDPDAAILVVAAAHDPQDLRDRHAGGRFARAPAAQAGRALALLHATPPAVLGDEAAPLDPGWALRLHRPSLRMAQHLTAGASRLIRAIQASDELCSALDALHASRDDGSLVHGDVRWENVLTARHPAPRAGPTAGRRSRMLLVDWESAARGEPSLDLGAFFGEYLDDWVRSIPIVDPEDPGRMLAHAGRPLARMRPALAAFWEAYARSAQSAPRPAPRLGRTLRRAGSWAAVRVLASAYEDSLSRHELRGSARFAVQLSLNILRRPDEAIARLLGIGASWAPR